MIRAILTMAALLVSGAAFAEGFSFRPALVLSWNCQPDNYETCLNHIENFEPVTVEMVDGQGRWSATETVGSVRYYVAFSVRENGGSYSLFSYASVTDAATGNLVEDLNFLIGNVGREVARVSSVSSPLQTPDGRTHDVWVSVEGAGVGETAPAKLRELAAQARAARPARK